MISMDVNHPEIEDFIDIKTDLNRVTKANISVRVDDEFMNKVMNNEKHVFFNGYTFNFSTLPPILIQWVKTAVSVPIVCGFAAYCVHKIYDFIASRFLRSTDKNAGGDSE